jgi:HPt (histidine-containing phosphotransfer) domain-containing protein
MAVKVSSSRNWETDKIIEEIKQPNIKVVIYFFSPSIEQHNPHTFFSETFPEAVCVGASMYGGWSSGGAVETGIAAMSLSSDEVEQTWFTFHEGVKKNPVIVAYSAIIDLLQKTPDEKINPDEYLGLIFFDGLCLGESIIKEFSMEPRLNMAFIGGAAADEMNFKKTTVSCGNKLSEDGLVAVILKMKIPFFFNHYVHYFPTDISLNITKVEISKRIAWEINGEPAADFYAKKVGAGDASKLTPEIFAKNPVGLKLGKSIYIRSPKCVVDGNGLQFYCYVEAGTKVFLLKQKDIIEQTEKSIAATSQFLPGIQGCLIFNCVQRHLALVEKNKIDEFNNISKDYPMIGFNTFGEELFTHHNQTLTAVFFGTLPEQGMADPYKTKRLFHYTDSKLKSIVLDIVNRSEVLNSTVSFLKKSINAESPAIYEVIKERLGEMSEQSDISKQDIERMLVVYQNNVERTGEYVFNIVDEIRKQNRRLIELKEEADTANRTKSSILASMSSEIRTPMNTITEMAELLLGSDLPAEAKKLAQEIKQAGNNLSSIINDILDFSKMDSIEAASHNDILNRWMPEDKKVQKDGEDETAQNDGGLPVINGVNVQAGIEMTGGTLEDYYVVLSMFLKDAQNKLKSLDKESKKEDLSSFVINIHTLKSSSASIGADEISAEAARLEKAGKEGDVAFIRKNLSKFTKGLSTLINGIKTAAVNEELPHDNS